MEKCTNQSQKSNITNSHLIPIHIKSVTFIMVYLSYLLSPLLFLRRRISKVFMALLVPEAGSAVYVLPGEFDSRNKHIILYSLLSPVTQGDDGSNCSRITIIIHE